MLLETIRNDEKREFAMLAAHKLKTNRAHELNYRPLDMSMTQYMHQVRGHELGHLPTDFKMYMLMMDDGKFSGLIHCDLCAAKFNAMHGNPWFCGADTDKHVVKRQRIINHVKVHHPSYFQSIR